MKALLILLLSAELCSAAFTTRWVTDAGAGAADGTSEAAAMSFATFTDYMVTGGSFTAAAGDQFNIIGTITSRTTTTDTWVNGGNATSPVIVKGVVSGGGTAYAGRSNGALVTTNFPSLTYTTGGITITGSFIIVECLNIISGRSSDAITMTTGTDCAIVRCAVNNSSTNASAGGISATTARSIAFDCDATMSGASGGLRAMIAGGVSSTIDSCRIKVTSATCVGISCAGNPIIFGNLIYASGGIGISMTTNTGVPYIRSNTIVGCGGDGINIVTGTTGLQRIIGNMITDNTGDGIDMTQTSIAGFLAYNRLRDNSSSIASGGDWITGTSYGQASLDTGTTGTTATDYTNYAGNDFSLVRTSPATSAIVPASASAGAFQRLQTTVSGEDINGSAN